MKDKILEKASLVVRNQSMEINNEFSQIEYDVEIEIISLAESLNKSKSFVGDLLTIQKSLRDDWE
ncbi:hypothetical protein [Rickettsiella massiliensis]|uniref:hypothetical protein n=1 Tax=Rickettsiella massiliensis TaxID=676517 RepID=UPI00029B3330|nr:hypothetical protein [Rickettsiella massiliensis]